MIITKYIMFPILKGLLPLNYNEYITKYLILLEFVSKENESYPKDIFSVINHFYFLSVYTSAKVICGPRKAMIIVNDEAFDIKNNGILTKLNFNNVKSWSCFW